MEEIRSMQLSELDRLTKDNMELKKVLTKLESKLKETKEAHK